MSGTWKSKLNNTYDRDYVNSLDKPHQQELKKLRYRADNKRCADCGSLDNTWAIVNHGVFVCVHCAHIHRSVAHVSKVKGCTGTYLWGPDEMDMMRNGGNAKAAERLGVQGGCAEAPGSAAGDQAWVAFVLAKYEQQRWAPKGRPASPPQQHEQAAKPAPAPTPAPAPAQGKQAQQEQEQAQAQLALVQRAQLAQQAPQVQRTAAPHSAARGPEKVRGKPLSMSELDSFFDSFSFPEDAPAAPTAPCTPKPEKPAQAPLSGSRQPASWEQDLIDL